MQSLVTFSSDELTDKKQCLLNLNLTILLRKTFRGYFWLYIQNHACM